MSRSWRKEGSKILEVYDKRGRKMRLTANTKKRYTPNFRDFRVANETRELRKYDYFSAAQTRNELRIRKKTIPLDPWLYLNIRRQPVGAQDKSVRRRAALKAAVKDMDAARFNA